MVKAPGRRRTEQTPCILTLRMRLAPSNTPRPLRMASLPPCATVVWSPVKSSHNCVHVAHSPLNPCACESFQTLANCCSPTCPGLLWHGIAHRAQIYRTPPIISLFTCNMQSVPLIVGLSVPIGHCPLVCTYPNRSVSSVSLPHLATSSKNPKYGEGEPSISSPASSDARTLPVR